MSSRNDDEMISSDYKLVQKLPYDLTRPVAEMAAFFDIMPHSDSAALLTVAARR